MICAACCLKALVVARYALANYIFRGFFGDFLMMFVDRFFYTY